MTVYLVMTASRAQPEGEEQIVLTEGAMVKYVGKPVKHLFMEEGCSRRLSGVPQVQETTEGFERIRNGKYCQKALSSFRRHREFFLDPVHGISHQCGPS